MVVSESKVEKIKNLDLSYLEKRLLEKSKQIQTIDEAKESVRRYKNFLILMLKYSKFKVIPTPDIDEVWHDHILHTIQYTRDTHAIFGNYLHHEPFHTQDDEKAQKDMNDENSELFYMTAALYIKEFQEPYTLELEISTFW